VMRIGYKAFGKCVPSIVIAYLRHYMLGIMTVVQWVFGIRYFWCCVLCIVYQVLGLSCIGY